MSVDVNTHMMMHMSMHTTMHMSMHVSMHMSMHKSMHMTMHMSMHMTMHMSMHCTFLKNVPTMYCLYTSTWASCTRKGKTAPTTIPIPPTKRKA